MGLRRSRSAAARKPLEVYVYVRSGGAWGSLVPWRALMEPDELARRLARYTRFESAARLRRAGVLVALAYPPDASEARVLLIQRTDHMRHHAGQYAFPGGARDEGDGTAIDTALREAHEEVGLAPGDARVLGLLDDQPTISGFLVTPVVAQIPHPYAFRPNPDEVAQIVQLPLPAFLAPPRTQALRGDAMQRIVLGFDVDGHFIWGATASILVTLARAIRS